MKADTGCDGACARGTCPDCDEVLAAYRVCTVCGGPCIETRPGHERPRYCSDECAMDAEDDDDLNDSDPAGGDDGYDSDIID